jgi:thiosulfate/3-mercaptopyruvate sulfurtransferase
MEDHLKDSNVRIAEVDYDPKANYQLGHVPFNEACEDLLQRAAVNNDTKLVLYSDFNNWFTAFAFWVFKYYRFKDVRIMNGGRKNG